MTEPHALTPKTVAVIRKQLLAANGRLVAIERERQELKAIIASLAAQLKERGDAMTVAKRKKGPRDLLRAIEALDALTIASVTGADDETLRKLYHLTQHWHQLAAHERRERAKA